MATAAEMNGGAGEKGTPLSDQLQRNGSEPMGNRGRLSHITYWAKVGISGRYAMKHYLFVPISNKLLQAAGLLAAGLLAILPASALPLGNGGWKMEGKEVDTSGINTNTPMNTSWKNQDDCSEGRTRRRVGGLFGIGSKDYGCLTDYEFAVLMQMQHANSIRLLEGISGGQREQQRIQLEYDREALRSIRDTSNRNRVRCTQAVYAEGNRYFASGASLIQCE